MAKKWHLDINFRSLKSQLRAAVFCEAELEKKKATRQVEEKQGMQEHKEDHLPSIFASFHSLSLSFFLRSDVFFLSLEKEKDFPS